MDDIDIDAIARRFAELPTGVPGHFTRDEVLRGQKVAEAEYTRSQAQLAALAVIKKAFKRHPDAENAGEAVRLAGLEGEMARCEDAIPDPDEVGLRWYVQNVERSIAEGTLIQPPLLRGV